MPQSAQDIRDRMRQVRTDIGDDMHDIVEATREMTDWRSYVKRYPWITVGAAVAVGYYVVPKCVSIISPNSDALLELARNNKLVFNAKPRTPVKSTLLSKVFSLVASTVLRRGVAYLIQPTNKAAKNTSDA